MDKQDRALAAFRDVYSKLAWLNSQSMKYSFGEYASSEVHCIEYIGKNADCNVTKLADAFFMTRGAISKTTKKLMQKGAIESYQRQDNKKEIYFRLTAQGKALLETHEALHERFKVRDKACFEQISEEQYTGMLQFMEAYAKHLDEEIKKLDIQE